MKLIIKESHQQVSELAAELIAQLLRRKPHAVLGLAAGTTPEQTYRKLVQRHRTAGLSFCGVTSFNLDEYVGLAADHPQSYRSQMNRSLFDQVNIDKALTHVPDGTHPKPTIACREYEQAITAAGGIDLQLLGLGRNGHIAFNEPGSSFASRTRVQPLNDVTIADNARFFASPQEVPRFAITMGIATVMGARQLLLLASSESKADAVAQMLQGPVTEQVPASIVQRHSNATVILDKAAASKLA